MKVKTWNQLYDIRTSLIKLYLSDKHQFVVVNELEFDFEENDVLSDEFLAKINTK